MVTIIEPIEIDGEVYDLKIVATRAPEGLVFEVDLQGVMGAFRVDVPASTLADPTSPTRAEWEAAVVAGEGRPTFFTGGIIHQSPDGVVSRRQAETLGASTASTSSSSSEGPSIVETRWMPRTYDEVREVDRVLARRDRDRGPAFDGGCVFPMGGTPFALKAGERVLTRADRLSRPKVTTREVAERFENTLKKEP